MNNKTIVVLLFFIVCCIVINAQGVNKKNIKTTYFVSSSIGDDKNDGLSEMTPKASISSIKEKLNVRIRLKSGDIFYEKLSGYNYCMIDSYGDGQKPIICGFKVLINPNAWKLEGNDVWVLDLSEEKNFIGFLRSNSSNPNTIDNVGLIYDSKNDKVYGRLKQYKDSLKKDGDFYMTSEHKPDYFKTHSFDKLYWKKKESPKLMGNLAFSTYNNGLSTLRNTTLRNIAVVGFSRHGITGCNKCLIEDCQIDLIGGGVFIKNNFWNRLGNGIELWYDCNDNTIKNCLISRTYDCATTIQGNKTNNVVVSNNHFVGNKIYHCRQAFEHFLKEESKESNSYYENCSFENNYCFEMGTNEFDSPERRDANILSYEDRPRPITIKDNYFYGANHLCGYSFSCGMADNYIFIYEDQYLNDYHAISRYKRINPMTNEDLENYQKRCLDNSKIFVLKRNTIKDRIVRRFVEQKVGWKPLIFPFNK